MVAKGTPWYGTSSFQIRYDLVEAKRLLAEAGYGPDKPLHLRFMISTSGSGQMYPLPMNEFVQQNLADVGVKLDLEVLEWQALRVRRDAGGAKGAGSKGIDAINNSWNSMDPLSAFLRHARLSTRKRKMPCWPRSIPAWSIKPTGSSWCTTSTRAR